MEEIQNSFCCGAAYGFLAAALLGLAFSQIHNARLKVSRKDRSLSSFPDGAQQTMTASDVVSASNQATITMVFWTFLLILFLGLVSYGIVVIFL